MRSRFGTVGPGRYLDDRSIDQNRLEFGIVAVRNLAGNIRTRQISDFGFRTNDAHTELRLVTGRLGAYSSKPAQEKDRGK